MKGLDNTLRLLAVALIAAVVLAAFMAARTTAREYYAYRAAVAPRTLHQMVMEMEAADQPERGNSLFWAVASADIRAVSSATPVAPAATVAFAASTAAAVAAATACAASAACRVPTAAASCACRVALAAAASCADHTASVA